MSVDQFYQLLNTPATNRPEDIAVVRAMIATQPDTAVLADMLGIEDAA